VQEDSHRKMHTLPASGEGIGAPILRNHSIRSWQCRYVPFDARKTASDQWTYVSSVSSAAAPSDLPFMQII
jgi:hypothetical protein